MSSVLVKILRRPVTTGMISIAVCCAGIVALSNLRVDVASSVERPALTVIALWDRTSPEGVERFVSRPLEEIVGSIKGVVSINSSSGAGFARLVIGFHPGSDVKFARLDLNERISRLASTLPPGVTIARVEPYVPREARQEREFLKYVLSGNEGVGELAAFAEREIVPRLSLINGVRQAVVEGGRDPELHIVLAGEALKALGLTPADIRTRLEETYPGLLSCRAASLREDLPLAIRTVAGTPEDLLGTIVGGSKNGVPVRLRSCASVRPSLTTPAVIHRVNGRPAVIVRIEKDPGVDALTVSSAVNGAMGEVRGILPPGLFLEQSVDATSQLRRELRWLAHEGGMSCLFVFLILVFFFGSARVAMVVFTSILVAAAATLSFLWLLGRELNLFSMAGLVTGLGRIVDDGLVVAESIQRHNGDVRRGVRSVGIAVSGSTAATLGAMIPVRFLPAEFRPPLADFCLAVGWSLAVSAVASFTLVPVLMNRFTDQQGDGPWACRLRGRLERVYRVLLAKALMHKKMTILTVVWLFGLPVWLMPERMSGTGVLPLAYNVTVGGSWFSAVRPYLEVIFGGVVYHFARGVLQGNDASLEEETGLLVEVRLPAGSGIEAADSVTIMFEQEALRHGRHVGAVRSRVQGDTGELRVEFTAPASGVAGEVRNRFTSIAARLGGAKIAVSGFGPGFATGGEGVSQIRVIVKGYSYATVKEIAEEFRRRASQHPRIGEVDIDRGSGSEEKLFEVVLVPDRDALAKRGLTIEWLVREVGPYTVGGGVSVLEDGEPRVRCSLQFDEAKILSVDELASLTLRMPGGRFCRVADVACIRTRRVQGLIVREDQRYIRRVSFTFRGPYRYAEAFLSRLLSSMVLPDGYAVVRQDPLEAESGIEQRALLPIGVAALVVVFMVAASVYESLVIPLVVMLTIPCSLIGVMGIFLVTDAPWGKGGAASAFLLIGIVVSNAVVLVDALHRRCHGGDSSVVANAAAERVRPVVMTTLTTAAAFVPMLVRGQPGGFWTSFALGSLGGILSSSLLCLFLIPPVFVVFRRFAEKRGRN